jgi:hypothetical protein
MAIVYIHKTLDTGEIFYVGIGKSTKRAYSTSVRNQLWANIVGKHGYEVEILYDGLTWETACDIEKQLIKQCGRRDLGTGTLCNMTEGGDGIKDLSTESRLKISTTSKGRVSTPEQNKKKGRPGMLHVNFGKFGPEHPKFGKPGRKWSQEERDKKAKEQLGVKFSQERKDLMKVPKGPQIKRECPHCKKSGGHAMTRWHFDNCKFKK